MKQVEKKLKKSLDILIPYHSHYQNNSFMNAFSYAIYAIFVFFIVVSFTKQNAILNVIDSDISLASAEQMTDIDDQSLEVTPFLASRMTRYPWQESEDYYTYQNTGDYFSVQIQDGKKKYQLEMSQGTLQGFGDATPILNTEVYFYIIPKGYIATWQYQEFTVSVESQESLPTLIRKVEKIMEENLI